ncbi:MAG: hypothetical protein ACK5WF_11755, partial [Cyclobacteriaceae bacterium]
HSITTGISKTDYTIHAWPTQITTMASELCPILKRNLTREEWEIFVAEDLDPEATCSNLPLNK